MKLSSKLVLLSSVMSLVVLVATFILAYFIVIPGFINVENSRMEKNIVRVQDTYIEYLVNTDKVTRDYAKWDVTYDYVLGENISYNDEVEGTLQNFDLDSMFILKNNGNILYASALRFESINSSNISDYSDPNYYSKIHQVEIELDNSDTLYSFIRKNSARFIQSSFESNPSILMSSPIGPILVFSRPVLRSDNSGNISGTLLFIKLVDDDFVLKMSDKLHLNITAYALGSNPDFVASYSSELILGSSSEKAVQFDSDKSEFDSRFLYAKTVLLSEKKNVAIYSSYSSNLVSGYFLLRDFSDSPSIIMEVTDSRDIYLQGLNSIKSFSIMLLILAVLFDILLIISLNRLFVRRILSIESNVSSMVMRTNSSLDTRTVSSDFNNNYNSDLDVSLRILDLGNDEISSLSKSFNKALDTIEKNSEEKNAILNANPDAFLRISEKGLILDYKLNDSFGTKKLVKGGALLQDLFNDVISDKIISAAVESLRIKAPVTLNFQMDIEGFKNFQECRLIAIKRGVNNEFLVILRDVTSSKNMEQDLTSKNVALEKFNKFATDRELRMIELKKEISELKSKLDKSEKR
jgi:sensor domain CHASE-containing protein